MDDDDFVAEGFKKSISKAKSTSRSDAQFVAPRPVTPRKEKTSPRVTDSENSTAVAGNLTETDDSALPSRDITSAEEVVGSHSECPTEDDSLFSSPTSAKPEQWELVKTWIRSVYSINTIFEEIVAMCKVEQLAAGCVKSENLFDADTGHVQFRCKHISGFSRSHVRLFSSFVCFFINSDTVMHSVKYENMIVGHTSGRAA